MPFVLPAPNVAAVDLSLRGEFGSIYDEHLGNLVAFYQLHHSFIIPLHQLK